MAQVGYVVDTASTRSVPIPERAEYWNHKTDAFVLPTTQVCFSPQNFRASMTCQKTEFYQLARWEQIGENQVRRSRRLARCEQGNDYLLLLSVAGCILARSGDDESSFTPGTALLTDAAVMPDFRTAYSMGFALRVPRQEVDPDLKGSSVEFSLATGLGSVVESMIHNVYQERNNFNALHFNAACQRINELLCMLAAGEKAPSSGVAREVEAAVRKFVRERADDRALSPIDVAHGVGWSLRSLQRMLRDVGTSPYHVIRDERLRLAREQLRNPKYSKYSIRDIAFSSGFTSYSVMNEAFRHKYGMTPGEFRHSAVPALPE